MKRQSCIDQERTSALLKFIEEIAIKEKVLLQAVSSIMEERFPKKLKQFAALEVETFNGQTLCQVLAEQVMDNYKSHEYKGDRTENIPAQEIRIREKHFEKYDMIASATFLTAACQLLTASLSISISFVTISAGMVHIRIKSIWE